MRSVSIYDIHRREMCEYYPTCHHQTSVDSCFCAGGSIKATRPNRIRMTGKTVIIADSTGYSLVELESPSMIELMDWTQVPLAQGSPVRSSITVTKTTLCSPFGLVLGHWECL
ncbi:hypothetical protein FRC02_003351 [Tulasnella sp. 418]|nr:hypothetical protein FRC02_003351 [Tulasnella sp. 418]